MRLRWTIVLAAAAALRLWVLSRAAIIDTDGAFYAAHAMELAHGRPELFLSAAWPPLFPAAIAAVAWALAPWSHADAPALFDLAARLVSVAAGVLLPLPVFALARRAAGTRVAGVAALLVAFHPRLAEYSAAALTESLFTLLVVTAVAAFAWEDDAFTSRGSRRALTGAALAGALLGCAFLVRTEGLLVLACLLVVAVWPRAGGPRTVRAVLLAASALVFIVPFVAFVHSRTGAWSVGEKSAYNFWRAFAGAYDAQYGRPDWLVQRMTNGPEIAAAAPAGTLHALAFAARNPGLVVSLWGRQLVENVFASFPAAAYFPYVAIALFGLFGPKRVRLRPLAGALLAMAVLVAVYSLFTRDRRFFVPFVPFVLIWVAAGLVAIAEGLASARKWSGSLALRAACVLVCTAGVAYTAAVTLRAGGAPEHRRAAAWLRERGITSGIQRRIVVMARKPFVAYYADAEIAGLPDLPEDQLVRLATDLHVDYVVADSRALADRPALRAWLAPGGAPWQVVHEEPGPDRLLLLDAHDPNPEHGRVLHDR